VFIDFIVNLCYVNLFLFEDLFVKKFLLDFVNLSNSN